MSNAIVVPAAFNGGQVAAAFQGQGAGEDLAGGITGGYGLLKYRGKVWSVQHNGQSAVLMREDGDGPRGSVDLVFLKANAQLSKTFYLNGWDENSNAAPDCASANGIVPDQGVPHPQSPACASCPRNAWGSAPNGGKGKACGDHRRIAVVPLADIRNEFYGGPLLLRVPAASLQDLAAFDARYKGLGYPYFTMAIKVSFDPAESFPKFVFQAVRPLNDAEAAVVLELRSGPEVARVVHEQSAPAPAQLAAPAQQAAFLEPAPVNAVQPQQVQVQPVVAQPAPVAAQPQPAPAAAPAVNAGGFGATAASAQPAPVVQPAVQQVAPQPAPAQAGGFGPAAVQPAAQPAAAQQGGAQAAPNPAQAAGSAPAAAGPAVAQRPSQQMTGFGPTAVTPEVTPQAVQPAVAQQPAPAVSPATVSAFEGSIDDRLNALLADTAQPAA